MSSTKEKILDAALRLFNERGVVNVRLQQIADLTGISVGNLAYHYPGKKAIIEKIDRQLEGEITPLLSDEQRFPTLIDFDNQLSSYYFLLKRYPFYFLDMLEMERAYPRIHQKRQAYIGRMIRQITAWMHQNVEKGLFVAELQENQYERTAQTIWIIITFWMTQQQVRGIDYEEEGAFKGFVWNQLLPLFTPQALIEYEALILPQLKHFSLINGNSK